MKRILLATALLAASTVAFAGHWGHHGHRSYGWVAPVIIGGAAVYALTRPTVVQPAPVYVQPAPQVQLPPAGYHWEQILDANCNCNRIVLAPN